MQIEPQGRMCFYTLTGTQSNEVRYELDIKLQRRLNPAQCTWLVEASTVTLRLARAISTPYWKRLLKARRRNEHCRFDWASWIYENDEVVLC